MTFNLDTFTLESSYEIQERDEDGRDEDDDDHDYGEDPGPSVHTPRVTGGGQVADGGAVPLRPRHQHHQLPGGLKGQPPDVGSVGARYQIIVQPFIQTVNLECWSFGIA